MDCKVRARVGLYTTGLHAYWAQFPGLHDRLLEYNKFIEKKISAFGEVFNYGLVDNEPASRKAGEYFNSSNVDIIIVHSGTYFTSSCVIPIHNICKAPTVVLNLQPTEQMNYAKTDTGEWLAHCVGCPIPEIANAFERAGIKANIVNGLLGLDYTPAISVTEENTSTHPSAKRAWKEIEEWVKAAGVKRMLSESRFGFLGNNYSGMLDLYSDWTMLSAQTGIHVELLEMCDLEKNLQKVTPEEISQKRKDIESFFEILGDSPSDPRVRKPTEEQLNWSATVAAAQYRLVKEFNLDALSYYYHSADGFHYEDLQGGFIVGHSLLTADGIPCAGEGDIKTDVAMKICDSLGLGGSFSEIVAMDYKYNTILLGHDGPFHIAISEGRPVLRGMGVYHGKKGSGISVEAHVKSGPVTMLGLTQLGNGRLRFIVSEGEAIPNPILTIGNTQTHVDFGMDIDEYQDIWYQAAPTHHCAMSIGHNRGIFRKICDIMNIDYVYVGR